MMKKAKNGEFRVGTGSNMRDGTAREDPENYVIGEFPSGKSGVRVEKKPAAPDVLSDVCFAVRRTAPMEITQYICHCWEKKRTRNRTGNRTHGKAALWV